MSMYGPGLRTLAAMSGGIARPANRTDEKVSARILVIDDEDFVRDLYKEAFEAKGHTVFSARNGEEAVEVFRGMRHRPDVVIMDHRMPGKDGIETTQDLLRLDPGATVIFSSADETVREQALRAGAVSFWIKPFPISLLIDAMTDLVKAKRRR